jgi:GTP cyclohydrolase I
MNAPENKSLLPDIQSIADLRNLTIQRVGVKSVVFPVKIAGNGVGNTAVHASVATIDMYVALPPEAKGTHMSRFLEVLHDMDEPLSFSTMRQLMVKMLHRLDASSGYVEMRMPYFMMKTAPVSGVESLMDYQLTLKAEQKNGALTYTQQVLVPVTSLCPCSKGISAYGAHNQRSHVTIAAQLADDVPIDDLIRIAEAAASCELYGLLKRPDEKYVTERAYDNPKFVEDLVRDIALALNGNDRIVAYTVESENFESIHNHSAYALIEHDKRLG